ncbi:MAG: acetate--CoA ligase family protein, partial [Pseudomonadota bacterium]
SFIDADTSLPQRFDLRFPVAAKIVSPDIVHKTEAGGVRLRVTEADVARTLAEIHASAKAYAPDAHIRGFLLEEMAEGVEMIVGALNNASFGPLVVVGVGGVHAEVFRDIVRRYAPVSVDEAREMILELKGAALLQSFRGQPVRDIDALAQIVARISWMIVDHEREVAEIEINPVMVSVEGLGATAVDAFIQMKSI